MLYTPSLAELFGCWVERLNGKRAERPFAHLGSRPNSQVADGGSAVRGAATLRLRHASSCAQTALPALTAIAESAASTADAAPTDAVSADAPPTDTSPRHHYRAATVVAPHLVGSAHTALDAQSS